jgi:hypothetical protein
MSAVTPTSVCLDFPLRPDYMAQVVIPRAFTQADAVRMALFLLTLADEPFIESVDLLTRAAQRLESEVPQ